MRATDQHEILLSLGKNLPGIIFYRFIRKKDEALSCDFVSENIVDLTGYTAEEVIANPGILRNFILPEYLPHIDENTQRSFKDLCNFEIEIECNSLKNGIRWMKVICIPEVKENGDVIWFGIQTDITEEKKLNRRIQKSNHELRLLNNINDILTKEENEQAIYDLVCECLVVKGGYKLAWIGHMPENDEGERIVKARSSFGSTEYLTNTVIDLNDPIKGNGPTGKVMKNGGKYVNNNAAINPDFQPWLEAAQHFDIRSSIVLELDIFEKKRSVLNIYAKSVDAFDENEVLVLERVARNVSSTIRNIYIEQEKRDKTQQLNASEANLKSIFDHTDVGYMLLDLDYKIISFNQSIYSIFYLHGKANLEVGKNFLELIDFEKSIQFSNVFEKAITLKDTIEYENQYLKNNKNYFYYNTVIPVKSGNEIIGICLSKFDISKRKNEELIKEKITNDLLQRNRDLEQFAYIISHNLRAPVANILGLNLLLNDNPSEEYRIEILKKLDLSANRLDSVIKDLNNILQVRREVSEMKTDIDLHQLVENVKESISNLIENKKVDFKINFDKINNIKSIRTYLGSVFFNLITNSLKYSKKDSPICICISSERDKNSIIIKYQDNGIGIDLNKYGDQLFGLYKKFNTEVEGKGIGLYMVKTQVEVMGGTISLDSKLNEGTEFTIQLPIS